MTRIRGKAGVDEWGAPRGSSVVEGETGRRIASAAAGRKDGRSEERSAAGESPLVAVDTCPLGEGREGRTGGHLSSSQRGTIPVRHFTVLQREREKVREREKATTW